MDNEHSYCVDVRNIPKPYDVTLNMDEYYGGGIKSFKIICDGKEIKFSKDEIFQLLKKFKGIPND